MHMRNAARTTADCAPIFVLALNQANIIHAFDCEKIAVEFGITTVIRAIKLDINSLSFVMIGVGRVISGGQARYSKRNPWIHP